MGAAIGMDMIRTVTVTMDATTTNVTIMMITVEVGIIMMTNPVSTS
jgi:hypothetical protein